jgi:hypothetical protein
VRPVTATAAAAVASWLIQLRKGVIWVSAAWRSSRSEELPQTGTAWALLAMPMRRQRRP